MGKKNVKSLFSLLNGKNCSVTIAYSNVVYYFSFTVFLLAFILFGVLPLIILFYFPLKLDSNPEKGFDTRDTDYAGARLAWIKLQPSLLLGSRIIAKTINSSEIQKHRLKKEIYNYISFHKTKTKIFLSSNESNSKKFNYNVLQNNYKNLLGFDSHNINYVDKRIKRSWADDLISSFSSVACYDQPIPAINYLSQIIISIPSYHEMYSILFLNELCQIQTLLNNSLRVFDPLTPYRNIWHVGNYIACLTPDNRLNCSNLTKEDVKSAKLTIEMCSMYRKAIVNCRRSCEKHESFMQEIQNSEINIQCDRNCKILANVPQKCLTQMISDLFYRILPKDLSEKPFYINTFLPFYTFASYRMQGYDVPLNYFTSLEEKLKNVAKNFQTFKLKGLLLDIKRDILLEAAISDSKFSLIAGICVLLIIALYSISISYSFVVLLQLSLSVVSALSIYRIFSDEFQLLNLIVFVLLISIGSDGAFLLFSGFPPTQALNHVTFYKCLEHTSETMFLTQFSTIVPFFLNILSNVVAFRSFGLFAGLVLITNYFLLISFLPAYLIIQHRYLNPWLVRHLPSSLWFLFPTFFFSNVKNLRQVNTSKNKQIRNLYLQHNATIENSEISYFEKICVYIQALLYEVLPSVLIQGRFVWICSLSIVLSLASIICVMQLQLPQYNPLQLFINSNLHEFYDNHAEKFFYFVSSKIALPLTVRMVWGIQPLQSTSYFDSSQFSELTADPNFQLTTINKLKQLAMQIKKFRELPFIQHPYEFWPERYINWSSTSLCLDTETVCCNFNNDYYSDSYLDYCVRNSTTHLQTQYNDTLIYHNITFELLGYTALLPTRLKYSHRYSNLYESFSNFDREFQSNSKDLPFWYTTEWNLMSTWFDLQKSIIADCQKSIIISFIVVLIFAALFLRWKCICAMITIVGIIITTTGTVVFFGWKIGVLEGVILVLVVGLSFDYTLHYGAAILNNACAKHKIQCSIQKATLPVSMAALSSIVAGAVMLFAQTHAFFQVAAFLVISTTTSFLFATFFFLPLYYILLTKKKRNCKFCDKAIQISAFQLYNVPKH